MKRPQRDEIASLLLSLTDDSVEFRNRWRMIAGLAVWIILSGFTMVAYVFFVQQRLHALIVIVLSFLKYIPMIFVAYGLAKKMAARYVADIYELEDEGVATKFLEEVTFGYGDDDDGITIDEGRIHKEDETSPIILIGGPGKIQVNLGSAALLEKADGQPHVILPRKKPWELGRFERIREIDGNDAIEKFEYAIVNLRDQFVSHLAVRSRTKDGIPIEVTGIKIILHILRKDPGNVDNKPQDNGVTLVERAMRTLVYNQTIITPEPKSAAGVGFPWDTTAIPLVLTELENIITSHSLSEILSSTSQKEVDDAQKNNETIAQMRFELTGQQAVPTSKAHLQPPNFISHDKIKEHFFTSKFREKAAALGVEIEWIDIGTWNILSETIKDKLTNAKSLMHDNAKRRVTVEQSRKTHEMNEIMQLVQSVIIANYDNSAHTRRSTDRDLEKLKQFMNEHPELVKDQEYNQLVVKQTGSTKNTGAIANDLISAFRKELLAGSILIQREPKSQAEKQADLARIEKALKDMSKL